MCKHHPRCPDALAPDRAAARVRVTHPEQGWSLLCNGVVLFDDAGTLPPGGKAGGRPGSKAGGEADGEEVPVTDGPALLAVA